MVYLKQALSLLEQDVEDVLGAVGEVDWLVDACPQVQILLLIYFEIECQQKGVLTALKLNVLRF